MTLYAKWTINSGIETIANGELLIYPNPTKGELRVKSEELRVKSVAIFDITGKCHLSHVTGHNNAEIVIDISHLPQGIYFVKIATAKGEVVRKVIKE
jgi:hypothetical protein